MGFILCFYDYEKSLRTIRPKVALSVAERVFCCDQRDILAKVMTPCTIIQPANDAAIPNSVAEYMQTKIKGETTVDKIDMDGHFPHLDAHLQFFNVLGSVLGFNPHLESSSN